MTYKGYKCQFFRWIHLITNLLVQIFLGLPLELVHKYWRIGKYIGFSLYQLTLLSHTLLIKYFNYSIAIVYLLGVIAGSLGTSVTDPNVFLAGASGGVYALIAAHLATIVIVRINKPSKNEVL